jgi:pimeloyl-ACP methyl ester carboxylesterase
MTISLTPPERSQRIEREHGRHVGWTEWGPIGGRPVLFCTGAATSSSLGFGADAVHALGVRLICIDRAGLGRSQPDPDKDFARWTADVAAVLDTLDARRPPVVGFSQGAPFAVALAGAEQVSAVALVAGQDELAHPEVRALLPPEVAGMVAAIEADPVGFEAGFAARADADGMWALVEGMSGPEDRAHYRQPAFQTAYRQALKEGFEQGAAGYARDLTLAMRRWPTPPESLTIPVRLWYGGRDTSPVHSPDGGLLLSKRFPRAVRHFLPEEGAALLWTRAHDILKDLLEAR